MDNNYSLSDLKAITDGADMNGSWLFIILLLFILGGGNGFGFGNRNNGYTDATTNEILSGQKFDALSRQINQVGDGLCSSTYALNNSIKDGNSAVSGAVITEGRNIQQGLCDIKQDMANYVASIKENDLANTQKILDQISTNRIADMQNQINQLQLQSAMNGVVKYPMQSSYAMLNNPFCSCGCGCAN